MGMKLVRFLLVVLLSGSAGFFLGTHKYSFDWNNYRPSLSITNKEAPPEHQDVDFSLFWKTLTEIENSYYDKSLLDPEKLRDGAIQGMLQSLDDPYTVYLPPSQNEDFKEGLAGKFEGIGAELGMKEKQIIIVAPLDKSPAQKAGVKPGDAILKVDDKSTAGWSLSKAVENIRGPKGSTVTLNIIPQEGGDAKDVKITRDTITVESVTGRVQRIRDVQGIKISEALRGHENEEVAYIRLSQFGDNTNEEWTKLINNIQLKVTQEDNVKGIVLDLRNNPGGYLSDANFISSEFLRSGTVVIQEGSNGQRRRMNVQRRGALLEKPIIVLINKGSASASEIVAGALRDHGRARLVGETSFGKGTIQQAEDLGNGAGLHITIAKWLTPNGTWVNGEGLKPDVEVGANTNDPSHDIQLEKAIEELVK